MVKCFLETKEEGVAFIVRIRYVTYRLIEYGVSPIAVVQGVLSQSLLKPLATYLHHNIGVYAVVNRKGCLAFKAI